MFILISYFFIMYISKENQKRISQIHGICIIPDTIEEYVGGFSNIFTGVVVGIKEEHNTRGEIPTTDYIVDVVDNIKGNLKGKVIVNQIGGDFKDVVVYTDTPNLKVGNLYLFSTRFIESNIKNKVHSQSPCSRSLTLISEKPGNKKENIELSRNNKRYFELLKAYSNEIPKKRSKEIKISGNFFKDLTKDEKNKIYQRIKEIEKKIKEGKILEVEKKEKQYNRFENLSIEEKNKIKEKIKKIESEMREKYEKEKPCTNIRPENAHQKNKFLSIYGENQLHPETTYTNSNMGFTLYWVLQVES